MSTLLSKIQYMSLAALVVIGANTNIEKKVLDRVYPNPTTFRNTGISHISEIILYNKDGTTQTGVIDYNETISNPSHSYIEDTVEQLTIFDKPILNIGDVTRTAYGLADKTISGIPGPNDSIISDGTLYELEPIGHDSHLYVKQNKGLHRLKF